MVATVEDFIAEHIVEHRSRFNQWCHFIGYTGLGAGSLITILAPGHRPIGGGFLLTGFGIAAVGHIADRNLTDALGVFLKHPIWNVRGDLVVIRLLFQRDR